MPQPVIYNASKESIRVPEPEVVQPPHEVVIEGDPMNAFENYHFQVRADLSGWMTRGEEDRITRAKQFSHCEEDQALKINPARRHKILCYIVWMEAHHKLGSSKVAAVAFHGLFDKKKGNGGS